jgi:hypothetical protein
MGKLNVPPLLTGLRMMFHRLSNSCKKAFARELRE